MPINSDTEPDLVALDAEAVRLGLDLLVGVTPDDLRRPTPCAGWTLYGLLAHLTAQHEGFAAAYDGDASLDRWKWPALGTDPVAVYRASAERVVTAFANRDLERMLPMPEFGPDVVLPASQAIGFHLVDYVVHAWDLTRTLDRPLDVSPALLAAAWEVARAVPDDPELRSAPGAPFGPRVSWPDDSSLESLVACFGRSPRWPK